MVRAVGDPQNNRGVTINIGDIFVLSGTSIVATGGYLSDSGIGKGSQSTHGSGGAHGGEGGDSQQVVGGRGYGDLEEPITLGYVTFFEIF
jgi:hypothetical protein